MSLTLSSNFLIPELSPIKINVISKELFSHELKLNVNENFNDLYILSPILDDCDISIIANNIINLSTSKQSIQRIISNVFGKLVLIASIVNNKKSVNKLIDLSKLLHDNLTNQFKSLLTFVNIDSFYNMALKGLKNNLQVLFIEELAKSYNICGLIDLISQSENNHLEGTIYKTFLDSIDNSNYEKCLNLFLKQKVETLDSKAKFLFFNHLNLKNLKEMFDQVKEKCKESEILQVVEYVSNTDFKNLVKFKKTSKLPNKVLNEYLYSVFLNTFGLNNNKISFKQIESELKVRYFYIIDFI